jgi:hypothetical protein
VKNGCVLHWTGINWRRSVNNILEGQPHETLDAAIHAAHDAGREIVDVLRTLGGARLAKEERAGAAEGTEES